MRVAQAFGCILVIHKVERLETSAILRLKYIEYEERACLLERCLRDDSTLFPPEAPTLMIKITLYLTFGSENFKKARTPQGIIHVRSGSVIARSNRVSRR